MNAKKRRSISGVDAGHGSWTDRIGDYKRLQVTLICADCQAAKRKAARLAKILGPGHGEVMCARNARINTRKGFGSGITMRRWKNRHRKPPLPNYK